VKHYRRRRNAIVHGHRFLDAVTDGEVIVNEIEELARAFMQQLLTDPAMFEKIMSLQQGRTGQASLQGFS
jgi:hypothetical protein